MTEDTAVRLLRVEVDRERKGCPGFPPPGLLPALLAMLESGGPYVALVRELNDEIVRLRDQLVAVELRAAEPERPR